MHSWIATGLPVHIVVYEDEECEYRTAVRGTKIKVLLVECPEAERSVGRSRQACLDWAIALGHQMHIQCDDDHIAPRNTEDLLTTLRCHSQIGVVSAWKRQYGHFLGKMLADPREILPNQTAMAGNLWALRHQFSFDTSMRLAEDCDLRMQWGWHNGARPLMHKGVVATPIGGRYQPGGCQTTGSGDANVVQAASVLNARYGEGTAKVSERPDGSLKFTLYSAKFWGRVDERFGL